MYRYNNTKCESEVIPVRPILAVFCALVLVCAGVIPFYSSAAETGEDWDEEFGEEEFWDDGFWDDEFDFGDEDDDFSDEEDNFNILKDPYTANDFAGPDQIETRVCGDYIYCLSEDGQGACTLSYTGNETEVVVPEQLDGLPVVAIGDHTFNYQENIVSIELPSTITEIGTMAFFKCSALQSIVIPEGVTLLDQSCFAGCEELVSVAVPESVETVGDFAFLACSQLTEIAFGEQLRSIGQGAFQLCTALIRIIIPSTAEIGPDAFTDTPGELEILDHHT